LQFETFTDPEVIEHVIRGAAAHLKSERNRNLLRNWRIAA
jgi:hypothetical protein